MALNQIPVIYMRGVQLERFSWQSDRDYRVLIDHLQDGIFVIDDGMIVFVNPRLAEMIGRAAEELIGIPFIELIAVEEQSLVWERHRARLAGENVPDQYDFHIVTARGTYIYCSMNVSMVVAPDGHSIAIGSVRDVTQQRAALAELETSKMELKSIFDELPDVFYRTTMQGIITMISPSCFGVLGYRQEEMLGRHMSDFYITPEEREKVVQAITAGGGKATRVEAGLKHKDGSTIWIATNAFVRYDSSHQPITVDGVARDVSERKQMLDQLTALTRTDGLTGVYNRGYFMEKSEVVIEAMRRYQHPVSMMMLDLDYFKKINDQYGHHVGDLALLAFTRACREEIRESDVFGRLGGEEFGLMLPETSIQNAQILAERIRTATAAIMIPLGEQRIGVTVSIGLVELGTKDISLDSVMRRADFAMYQAKDRGRNQVVTSFGMAGSESASH